MVDQKVNIDMEADEANVSSQGDRWDKEPVKWEYSQDSIGGKTEKR